MRRAVTALLLALLVGAIGSVELGLRSPQGAYDIAELPLPDAVEPTIEQLRARPFVAIRDPRAAAIVSGVVFGRTEHVDPAAQEAFLSSGLWHLLAASGQNIALIAGCCIMLARAAGRSRVAGAWLALGAIPAYVAVVGGGASIVRAGIMGELLLVAWLLGQVADVRRVLLLAATTICWAWPGSHRLLGFQLSFACVIVLLRFAGPTQHRLEGVGVPRSIAAGIAATVTCSLATAPILLLRTGSAPLLGALANVIAVPLAGVILVVGLGASLLELACPASLGSVDLQAASELPLRGAGLLGGLLLAIAERAARLPLAQTGSPALAFGLPALSLAAALAPERRRRSIMSIGAGLGCGLLLATWFAPSVLDVGALGGRRRVPPPRAGVLRIASLDIGQGDATLLMVDGHALLVDTGPPRGGVVARAREAGAKRVDAVLLTHDSLDHRGDLDAAVAGLRPARLVIPRNALGEWGRVRALGLPVDEVCAGNRLALARARITVLNPPCTGRVPDLTGDQHNDNAIVLLVEFGATRALLLADTESPAVLRVHPGPVDVLRVAHHGSRDERLPELLRELGPDVALVSVGAHNTYGHPAPSTIAALQDVGARVLRTDRDGSVVLDDDGRTVTLR